MPDTPTPIVPQRKLLTEDRNAVTRVAPNGDQKIVKVPDRAAEAAKQGVSEAQV